MSVQIILLQNAYALNETLHKKDIDEKLRSQFVGSILLYIRSLIKRHGIIEINKQTISTLRAYWQMLEAEQVRTGIATTLTSLLDDSDRNKKLKIEILQSSVLENEKVRRLKVDDWTQILCEITENIYKYINMDSSEGQDILNLFFVAFNKYTGKADKNQAFTPDHITNFMCRALGVDCTKRVFDGTCGSGTFLVQAMVLELSDCNRRVATDDEKQILRKKVVKENIYGIELEERPYGLATTNMLIHGDGNSNIEKGNLFESEAFFRKANPDIILMNPPYNAKPITIPAKYKAGWKSDMKEDPTKGMVFLKFISDMVAKMNKERESAGKSAKHVKIAILLPVATAIGTSNSYISDMKKTLLENNTLEAVFTLPNEIFYPGASASACCMVFTLGKPHVNPDGTINKTFFGYFKDDGHKKKKNLGRVEQFKGDQSLWKEIEEEWLSLFRNKEAKPGLSAMHAVSGDDEWLCEAYMETDYSKLTQADFQRQLNNYLAYLVKAGKVKKLLLPSNMTFA